MFRHAAVLLLGLCLRTLAAPDEAASGIPHIIAWQTGGELSFTALSKKADAGNPRAMAQLGFRLMLTRERPYDAKRVFKLLSQAAKANDPLGHAGLSWCYAEGRGCPRNPELQYKHAAASAKSGFHHGVYQLALCYEYGAGVPPDPTRAKQLFTQAIAGGNPWAKRKLAVADLYIPDRRQAAVDTIEELARNDFPPALLDAGRLALSDRRPDACLEAIGRSARMGLTYAMVEYGRRLLHQNKPIEGADWLMEAEERGDPFGQGALGKTIFEAEENPTIAGSYAASFHFLSESLHRIGDDPDVATKLAFHHCFGQGTPRDHAKAVAMIQQAWKIFDHGNYSDNCLLTVSSAQIYAMMAPPFQDLPKAIAYAQLCQRPYGDSVGYVAWLNSLNGPGQPNDPVRAWAAVLTGKRMGLESNTLARAEKNLKGKLTPEQLELAKSLSADGFPTSLESQQEAARILGRPVPDRLLGAGH